MIDAVALRELRSGVLRLKWQLATVRFDLFMRRQARARALKANFNPNQPRVPAGVPEGGRWTDAGWGSSRQRPSTRFPGSPRSRSTGFSGTQNRVATDFSSQSQKIPAYSGPRGHHYVPKAVFEDRGFPKDTKKVFDNARTGRLLGQRHGWGDDHGPYNDAVDKLLDKFLSDRGLTAATTTPKDAKEFVDQVKRSRDPRIRNLNIKIFRRELLFIMRFGARRPD